MVRWKDYFIIQKITTQEYTVYKYVCTVRTISGSNNSWRRGHILTIIRITISVFDISVRVHTTYKI